MLPYWYDAIVPDLRGGKTVLVTAHGNSLRALVKHLDGISDADIAGLNIPTGIPLLYELDDDLQAGRPPVAATSTRRPPRPPSRPSRTRARRSSRQRPPTHRTAASWRPAGAHSQLRRRLAERSGGPQAIVQFSPSGCRPVTT